MMPYARVCDPLARRMGGALVAALLGVAGCVGPTASPAPSDQPTCLPGGVNTILCPWGSGRTELLRMSNCFVMTHTIITSVLVFRPDYPAGTRAPEDGLTVASLRAFLCEQASTAEETVAPFHFAYFASAIDPPGPSADGASETLAAHQLLTNGAPVGSAAEELGLSLGVVGNFSFEQDSAPGLYVSPYRLMVPADRPMYAFEGTSNAGPGEVPDHASLFLYLTAAHGRTILVKISFDSVLANPSQPAMSTFSPSSYWTQKSSLTLHPSVNYQRRGASGNMTIEFPERL